MSRLGHPYVLSVWLSWQGAVLCDMRPCGFLNHELSESSEWSERPLSIIGLEMCGFKNILLLLHRVDAAFVRNNKWCVTVFK